MRLERICLHEFSNNIDDMFTKIETTMTTIEGMGKIRESILCYSITTLCSGPNTLFNNYTNQLNDDIETKTGDNKHMEWPNVLQAS